MFGKRVTIAAPIAPATAMSATAARSPLKPKPGVKLINAGEVLPRVPFPRHGMPAL
jgi:hypothetical protein